MQVRNNQTGFDLKITATAIPFDALSNLCEASDATILSSPSSVAASLSNFRCTHAPRVSHQVNDSSLRRP